MNPELRRAMRNATRLVAMLKPGEKISREQAIDVLRAPDFPEPEPTVRHGYKHYVMRGGIQNADAIITYREAAELASTSVDALRSAAYRGDLVTLQSRTSRPGVRERTGITLRSLAEFKRWTHGSLRLRPARWPSGARWTNDRAEIASSLRGRAAGWTDQARSLQSDVVAERSISATRPNRCSRCSLESRGDPQVDREPSALGGRMNAKFRPLQNPPDGRDFIQAERAMRGKCIKCGWNPRTRRRLLCQECAQRMQDEQDVAYARRAK